MNNTLRWISENAVYLSKIGSVLLLALGSGAGVEHIRGTRPAEIQASQLESDLIAANATYRTLYRECLADLTACRAECR